MVKIKENLPHILHDGNIDLEAWLSHLATKKLYQDSMLIRHACVLSQLAGQDVPTQTSGSCFQQGLAIAEILSELDLDQETIAAGIVYASYLYAELRVDDISEQLNPTVAKLVEGVERMNTINIMLNTKVSHSRTQLDNIRKMLLAIVDDVRIVLIKIAERLHVLRTIGHLPSSVQQQISQEAMQLYAPLANRLGIGQLKWELEDLAFRYMQPEKYKEIAKGLKSKRIERDNFINTLIKTLKDQIAQLGIRNFNVHGRSKHIHSIYRKMIRKHIELNKIYDATAVRVLVPKIEDCYHVLSFVHQAWQPIPEEFDDYIATPKPNGYRSIHTAVSDDVGHVFEVQIRTHEMQAEAELGIAAHWAYKEGAVLQKESHERKIAWLRQVLDWQKELISTQEDHALEQEFTEDHIYVFTPDGYIVDLAAGSTPLDFAYHIHSQVGHRCRGAKVDGHIVPLTYKLQTGQQVEILTAKEARPSRDWLDPHRHYLTTSRAKAKVLHWFRQQDYDRNLHEGKEIMERESRKLSLPSINYDELAPQLYFKTGNDLLAALGRGDIRLNQILNKIPEVEIKPQQPLPTIQKTSTPSRSAIQVEGVGNLLTHSAKCCQPVPGDPITGYITMGRGISVHRKDCVNIINAGEQQQKRLIHLEWGELSQERYPIEIQVQAYNRKNLLHDITSILSHEKINLLSVNSKADKTENTMMIHMTIELTNLSQLSMLLDRIRQLPNMIDVRRFTH